MVKKQINVPKLRFPGYSGEWKGIPFNMLVRRMSQTSSQSELPRVEYDDIISGQGILNNSFFHKKSNKKGVKFTNGDILFGKLRPYLNNWLVADFEGIAVGDWWVLRPKKTTTKFIYYLIQTSKYQMIANITTGTKMPRSDWKLVSSANFFVPKSTKEQGDIGAFFCELDSAITFQQQKLDHLKQLKCGLLQKMFPKKGAKAPEIRFPEFTGAWEQRKLGNISKMYQPSTIARADLMETGYPVFGANGYIGFYSDFNHKYDQVTISARGEETGTPNYVSGPVYITGNSMVVNVDDSGVDKNFLYSSLSSFSLNKYITGGAQPQLTREVLIKVPIFMPSIDEQKKIGSFFKQLDLIISSQQRKLDHLKLLKKGLLQQMLV